MNEWSATFRLSSLRRIQKWFLDGRSILGTLETANEGTTSTLLLTVPKFSVLVPVLWLLALSYDNNY